MAGLRYARSDRPGPVWQAHLWLLSRYLKLAPRLPAGRLEASCRNRCSLPLAPLRRRVCRGWPTGVWPDRPTPPCRRCGGCHLPDFPAPVAGPRPRYLSEAAGGGQWQDGSEWPSGPHPGPQAQRWRPMRPRLSGCSNRCGTWRCTRLTGRRPRQEPKWPCGCGGRNGSSGISFALGGCTGMHQRS